MFISRDKYERLKKDRDYYKDLYNKSEKKINDSKNEKIEKLSNTISSLNKSNVVSFDKIQDGDLVINELGLLRKVLVIGKNWVLNCNTSGTSLAVQVPDHYNRTFKGGPVSREQLIKYMEDKGYFKK